MSYQDEYDEHLAYGEYHGPPTLDGSVESTRNFLNDAWRRLRPPKTKNSSTVEVESLTGVDQHEAALAVSSGNAPPVNVPH